LKDFFQLRFQCLAVGHIHEDAFAGLVDAQFLALLVDMGDHQLGMLDGIGFQSHLPPYIFSISLEM
jgi:hypothetical protein